jgi:hypothetical protein
MTKQTSTFGRAKIYPALKPDIGLHNATFHSNVTTTIVAGFTTPHQDSHVRLASVRVFLIILVKIKV